MSAAFISIVIATRNRQRLLNETLAALVELRWPREQFEIIIADNGSTDGTAGVLARAAQRANTPNTRYLFVPQPGKSHAVNAALAIARGDLIALTDDDVLPDPEWLQELAAAFADTGADFIADRIFPRWESAPPHWMSPTLYGVLAIPDNGDARLEIVTGGSHVVPIGANMAVRASVFARVGGLRTDLGKLEGTLRTGEDHELFLRMLPPGYRGVYEPGEPGAVVRHWVPRERMDRGYCRRWLYQNGRDVAHLDRPHSSSVARLLGVPRYLWRDGASHLIAFARSAAGHDAPGRFAAEVRLAWVAGYVRQTWFGRRAPAPLSTQRPPAKVAA